MKNLLRILIAIALISTGVVLPASLAAAGGSPDVQLTRTVAPATLYGEPISVTLSAQQTTGPAGYNLTFTDFLPVGATIATSSEPGYQLIPLSDGRTKIIWSNVADLATGTVVPLTYTFTYPLGTYDVGDTFSSTATAYANSDPRILTKFNPTNGAVIAGTFSGSDTDTSATKLVPFTLDKSEPSPEAELLRGVQDHKTVYTLTIKNNSVNATSGFSVVDYLPAGLEFLGCTNVDNSAIGTEEYPGAGRISATPLPSAVDCAGLTSAATTVTTDPDGAGPRPNGVYTRVDWTALGTLAASGTLAIHYAAAIPLRQNVAAAGNATANLDNNTGALTSDEQELINYAVASGTYKGTVYTDDAQATVTAEDLAIQKTVDQPKIAQGATSVWTLAIESSEYANSTGVITVVDTIPDGLDYVSSSLAPTSVATNPDGTQTVTWSYPGLTAPSATGSITLTTLTRSTYRNGGGPVSSNDSWTNSVALTANATIITSPTGATTVLPVTDSSSADQKADGATLDKEVAEPAPVPTNCGDGTGYTFSQVDTGPFHPGDRVCYRLSVRYPGNLDTLGNKVTDFLPAGVTYESFQYTAASTVTAASGVVFTGSAADPLLTWDIGTVTTSGLFQVVVTTRITDINAVASGDITANLMKLTYKNTQGGVFQLRDLVNTKIEEPQLTLAKGIVKLNTVGVAGAPVDQLGVQGGDRVTYSVTVANSGAQDATAVSVRDVLPTQAACPDVSNISNSGSCDTANKWIQWTIPTVPANSTVTLTYDMVVPAGSSPGDDLLNTAGVRSYQGATNTGTAQNYVPSGNIDPSLEAQANTDPAKDDARVDVAQVGLAKSGTTSVTEGGNTAAQATIGELVTYTVTATIPQGSTLYGTAGITDAVSNRLAIVGTPTYTVRGGAPQNASVASNTITAPLTTPFVNAPGSGDDLVVLTFTARVVDVSGPVRGDTVPNRATFGFSNASAQPTTITSNSADVTIVEPDLTIPKSSDAVGGQVVGGQLVTYTLALTNGSGANVATAHDLVVVDTVPVSIQPTDAGGNPVTANATLPGGGVWNQAARTITFTQSSLAPATSQNLTYQAKVVDPVVSGSTIVNNVTVTGTSLGGPSANERTATSAAGGPGSGYQSTSSVTLGAPGITVAKSVTPTTRTIGERATYTLRVTIPSSTIAYDVTVLDTLPTGVKFSTPVSVGCVQGGGACSPNISATIVGNTGTDSPIGFFLGDLATAATADRVVTITYDGIVTPAASGTASVVNTATPVYNRTDKIAGTPGTAPTASSFDATGTPSSATVTIVEPRLTIDKRVGGQVGDSDARRAKPGDVLTYTVAVTNSGTSPAWDVDVTDTPDRRLTGYTSTPPAGVTATDADLTDGTLAWTIAGPIAVGATVTITYSATVPALGNSSEIIASSEVDNTVDIPHYTGVDPVVQDPAITYADYDNVTPDTVNVELDLASIGDRVWFDVNGDGVQDAAEPGLVGVKVTVVYLGADGVFGTADDESAVVTTGANGVWLASNLPGGAYRVTVDPTTLPGGLTPTYDLDGGTGSPNGVWQGTLAQNGAPRDVDFGYTGTGSIGDRVWYDQDKDGVQDPAEPGLPGATVTVVSGGADGDLSTTADNITYVTTTGANGIYLVGKLPAGPYSVTVTGLPTGYAVVADPAGGTSNTSTVSLPAGGAERGQDFGYAGTASVGDFVWLDRNGDGVQDLTEPGVDAATVTLTWFGVDGVAGGGDDAVFTTATTPGGLYLFDNLLPGKYSVAVIGGLPAAATNSYDRDGNKDSTTPVTVAIGDRIRDVDFGYDVASVLGDRVWWDLNSDGVQDAGEPGIPGVAITATYLGPDGVPGGGDDLVFTAVTGANGVWTITDVPDGKFVVTVGAGIPAGFAATYDADSGTVAPDGKSAVTLVGANLAQDFGYAGSSSIGDRIWQDLDGDGIQDAGEPGIGGVTVTLVWFGPDGVAGGGDDVTLTKVTDGTGAYTFGGLPAGKYSVTVDPATLPAGLTATYDLDGGRDSTALVTLPAATALTTVDFGYIGTGKIGDRVWLDQDGDGTIDPTEPGLAGVTVTLTWAGPDGVLGTADDVVTVKTTDATGGYLFDRLPSGLFTVALSGLPAGVSQTADPDGGADSKSQLTLAGGASNLAQDFGYRGTAAIGDLVWLDVDADGVQTGNEPGLGGISVTVRHPGADGIQGNADDIVVVTVTDAAGRYLASGLPAGTVVVSYDPTTLPAGYVAKSDLDGGSPSSATATLTTGQTRLDADFVVVGNAALNGVVFNDADGNGVRDPGDAGIPGVRVTVVWAGPNGPVTIVVVTDATGAWSLSQLPPGTYTATVDLTSVPTGFRPSTGTTSTVTVPAGGVRSVIQGVTTRSLAATGLITGGALYLGSSLVAAGLLAVAWAWMRRRRTA